MVGKAFASNLLLCRFLLLALALRTSFLPDMMDHGNALRLVVKVWWDTATSLSFPAWLGVSVLIVFRSRLTYTDCLCFQGHFPCRCGDQSVCQRRLCCDSTDGGVDLVFFLIVFLG